MTVYFTAKVKFHKKTYEQKGAMCAFPHLYIQQSTSLPDTHKDYPSLHDTSPILWMLSKAGHCAKLCCIWQNRHHNDIHVLISISVCWSGELFMLSLSRTALFSGALREHIQLSRFLILIQIVRHFLETLFFIVIIISSSISIKK
jgi:hypothetical protein